MGKVNNFIQNSIYCLENGYDLHLSAAGQKRTAWITNLFKETSRRRRAAPQSLCCVQADTSPFYLPVEGSKVIFMFLVFMQLKLSMCLCRERGLS
jgi:hypothetical protein